MAPRAVISGGESLDSPMRVTYEDSSASEDEHSGSRPTLKQVLKKPSRLLLRRPSISKISTPPSLTKTTNSPSTSSRRPSSSSGPGPVIPPRSRSLKFAPSLQSLQHRPRSQEDADVFGRESPLMETKSMTNALPELSQPTPKRILPRTNLEQIMLKPLPTAPSRQETVRIAHDTAPPEPALTALPQMRGPKADDTHQPQKRKSSGELADSEARSLPKTKADVVAEARSKKGPKSITRTAFAEASVMQWMDGVDVNGQRSPERNSTAGPSSPSKSSSHAAVVLSMLDQNRENIAQAAAKLCSATGVQHPPPVPVPERDASARRKRDSSMTATSFTPSIFSRTSSYTDHTFLTTPSEMVANNAGVQSKRTSRDSRDSWRYTRSFASPRSSVMSYSSIPFRSRPFKAEDFGSGPDDSNNNSPTDPSLPNRDSTSDEPRFSRDSASLSRGSYPGSEHLSVSFPRPLSLSPVEENPEIRVTSAMEIDKMPTIDMQNEAEEQKAEKESISMNTLDMKGTIASTTDSMDAIAKRSGRFCKGAFSPGMPTEIFGYHTLDFSNSRLSEDLIRQAPTIPETEEKMEVVEEKPKTKTRSLEHRRSSSSDVLNAEQNSPTLPKPAAAEPSSAPVRQHATVLNSVSSSEASLSPTDSEFGEGSSGITDYTDDDIYHLSDAPGIGRVLQIALANIRRDVVNLVVRELNGVSTLAHENNANGSYTGGQLPSQGGPSGGPTGGGQFGGNMGNNKRGARDRGDDQHEDREEGDPGKRRKLNTGAIHSSILRSRFACPFYKRNPDNHQRWRSCRGPGWEEVRRVKEHVYRRHMLFTCPRCLQHFEEKGLLDEHAQSDTPCTKATTPPLQDIEGCSQEQERKLRCRKRPPGETDEDRWAEMYRILFGDDCEVPGPYYDFDLPTTSPSPSDLPIIEDTFRQLPQRLAADISRRLRRPLDDDERDALPEIIRTSLQAVMPPFWRMFASTPGSDARAAPPASEQGDSAYGSAEHDRESSAPPRGQHFGAMSQTNFSQVQTPNHTPGQQHQVATTHQNPPPSREYSFTQNVEFAPQYSAWPQATSQAYVTMPQMPGTTTYPQTYHHAPVTMAQPNYATVQAHHDPPVHDDFADLLVPQQFMSGAGQQAHVKEESGLRWQIPTTIPGTTAADLPALPLDTIPFSMPTTEPQYHPATTTNYHQQTMTPTTTMGPSPNFQQYNANAPQMMQQLQHPSSMSYHESNSVALRTPNRNSVNLLTTTDQIDSWMFNLNANAAQAAQNGMHMQQMFSAGGNMNHHMNGMASVGIKGKQRRPEVGYTRG